MKSRASISASCCWGYQTLWNFSVSFFGLAMLLLPLVQCCKQQACLSNGARDANPSVVTLRKMLKLRIYNGNVSGSLLPVVFVLFVVYFSLLQNNKLSKLLAALSPIQVSWKTCLFFFLKVTTGLSCTQSKHPCVLFLLGHRVRAFLTWSWSTYSWRPRIKCVERG